MYSPKIREDLIPRIYRAAKEADLPMTAWVNRAVEKALPQAAAEQTKPTERMIVMNSRLEVKETSGMTADTLVIAKGEAGYRVCSPLNPGKQYVVTGIPDDPQCSCPDFNHPEKPAGWQCGHIQAVLQKVTTDGGGATSEERKTSAAPNSNGPGEPPATNGANGKKSPHGKNGKGIVMLLKRSVSPDGRIDSLSVEFTCPIGSATTEGIKELAQVILNLQGEIASGFLKANAKPKANSTESRPAAPANNGNNGSVVPDNAVTAQLLTVGTMNTRRGPKLVLNVMVSGQILKFFGSQDEIAEAIRGAGYTSAADHVSDGLALHVPCRVVTKPNGKYVNVERVYPAGPNGTKP